METITAEQRRIPPLPRQAGEPAWAGGTRPPRVRRPPVPRPPHRAQDPEQVFVTALRAAAPRFAAAAGAVTAVVAEAVPPARHRRARCRVVLLGDGGAERQRVFVGAAGRPGAGAAAAFTDGIARWLTGPGRSGDAGAGTDVVIDPPG